MSFVIETPRYKDVQAVLGAGGPILGRESDGGSGGGTVGAGWGGGIVYVDEYIVLGGRIL